MKPPQFINADNIFKGETFNITLRINRLKMLKFKLWIMWKLLGIIQRMFNCNIHFEMIEE